MGAFVKGFEKTAAVKKKLNPFTAGKADRPSQVQLDPAKPGSAMATSGVGTFATDSTGGGIAGGYI